MRLTGSRVYYRPTPPKMPTGLVQLMEGLTREVLKNNPTDVHGFCASHMQQLLEKRDDALQKKPLTLEEKIARAQEKVRQRAEKRRQQYDNDLLLRQHSGNAPETNKGDGPSFSSHELSPVNTLKTPINQEHELVNSSEVEISHENGTESHTPSEEPKIESFDNVPTKNNDVLKIDVHNEPRLEYEPKIESDIVESTQTIDYYIIAQDVPVNELPQTESSIPEEDFLDTEHPTENTNRNNLSESIGDGQTTYGENHSHKENNEFVSEANCVQEFDEVPTNQSPVNSMIVNQDGLPDGPIEKKIKDSAWAEMDRINDHENFNKDTSIISEQQNSTTQTATVTLNAAAESRSDTVHESNNIEKTQQPNNTQKTQQFIDVEYIKPLNDIDLVELSTNSGNKEDTIESKTIDLCYREFPSIELQDPVIDTDMLESLSATETDCDVATLITQDSTNYELILNDTLRNDISDAAESVTIAEIPQVDEESIKTISDNEGVDKNTQLQNKINSVNSTETPLIVSDTKNTNENNDNNNREQDKSKKLSENLQISNQDSNMNLETAAITIQKVFRTFLFKSRASTFDDTVNDETIYIDEDDKNKEECNFPIAGALNTERRPHGITRMDTVLQTVNEEKSLSLSTDDSSLSSAATVIQAHVRGFLVRNKLNSNKTVSTNSLPASNSNEPSLTSLEMDNDQNKNKTVLNIHIVPEGGNYLSRDESLITSMDLSLDSSPPSSINLQLHPLGYDKSERRKQLKREDAIQSISPPSNNSGKLSEDVDSVKELPLNDHVGIVDYPGEQDSVREKLHDSTSTENMNIVHVENIVNEVPGKQDTIHSEINIKQKRKSMTKMNSDEMDVVTALISNEENNSSDSQLMHSGEFHDAVLPTKVSRSDTSVASEFKNVLVYFLLWNNS